MPRSIDILLVVSHPDDDAIFAGALQLGWRMFDWAAACVTYTHDSARGREFINWQEFIGTDKQNVHLLGNNDDSRDLVESVCRIDGGSLREQLRDLDIVPRLVVTHNEMGEYGHPHHVLTHNVVKDVYSRSQLLLFAYGKSDYDVLVDSNCKVDALMRIYKSQHTILRGFDLSKETFAWAKKIVPDTRTTQ